MVKQGDTLYAIAKEFDTSVQAVKALNELSSDELAVGQQLKVKWCNTNVVVPCSMRQKK